MLARCYRTFLVTSTSSPDSARAPVQGEPLCQGFASTLRKAALLSMNDQLLRTRCPELWDVAVGYPAGLSVLTVPGEIRPTLLVKLPHQFLLTARMNRGFKVYVIPIQLEGISTIGLVSAFIDDEDNPLTVWSSLGADPDSQGLLRALRFGYVNIRMVDEHCREILAYEATIDVPLESRIRMDVAKFYETSHDLDHAMSEFATAWFSVRVTEDDLQALSVKFENPMYAEDRKFKDERPELFRFHGSTGFTEVSLVRLEPGQFQEMDIILLLQRIFSPEQIYHSPRRVNDCEEICDVLVIIDEFCLIVQAKDSPNTESMLAKSFERKRAKAKSQLHDGCNQIAGAIGYFRRVRPLRFTIDDREMEIDLGHRDILSLVVVRERFDYDFNDYSTRLMSLHQKTDLPCLGMGYGELIQFCTYCEGPDGLRRAYMQLFDEALNTGVFKRMRFGIRDLFNADGDFRF